MKKSKLFILLPLVALTLSGCNNTVVSETTSEAPQESETTKVNGYSSYTLEFSFYYRGVKESLPSGSTIYYAGETNNWSFTPLKESDGSFKLDVGAVEYKTYEYKLLIEYDDKTVSFNNEKVVWPTSGGATNASFTVSETDGGSQSITCSLSSSLEDILTSGEEDLGEDSSSETTSGDTSEGGGGTNPSSESGTSEESSSDSSIGTGGGGDLGGSETFTYSIVLNNADALQAMEYDAALTEQQGVDLDISLVTTSSTGEVTTKAATVNEVQFELTGEPIICFADLTVYPQASGETSFTISWPETTATPISVSVKITDVTQEVVTSLTNYTLRFNFTYDSQPDSVPESAELRILGSWDNDDNTTWSNYHVLTAESDGSYTYTIEKIDVLTDDDAWYTYVLVLGYPDEDWINWDYELTFVEDTYLSFGVTGEEGDNYVKDIALTLSAPMSSIISDLISEYTLTLTIYYEESAEALPTWADLYIAGSWTNWETFEQLTPTNEDRTEFTVTIHDVHPGWYNYDLVMCAAGTSPSWTNQITNSGDGYFEIKTGETSGSTSYTSSSALETIFPNPDTVTTATNYTVSFTITYGGTASYQLNDYVALYLQGDFDGDGTWEDPMEMTTTDHIIYSYTFSEITEVSHQYTIYYNYTGVTNFGDDDWAMKVVEGSDYTFTPNTTTVPIALSIEFDINTALTDPNEGGDTGDEGGEGGDEGTTALSSYTLVFTLYDANNQIQSCPSYGSLYLNGNFGGELVTSGDGDPYYQWSEEHIKLTETTYDSHVAYSINVSNVIPGETYAFNICFVYEGESDSMWRPINPEDEYQSNNFYCTIDSEAQEGGTQYESLTGCYTLNSEFTNKSYAESLQVVVTIKYDGTAQSCPSYGSLYMASGLNGSWNDEWNGYDWGSFVSLGQTTNGSSEVAYTYTYSDVEIGYEYSYNLYFAYQGASADWNGAIGEEQKLTVTESDKEAGVCYVEYTLTTPIETTFPESSTGGSEEGEDYTVVFTLLDTTSNAQQCPSWGTLWIDGNFNDPSNGSWTGTYVQLTETTDGSGRVAYSYTFSNLEANSTYTFMIKFVYNGEDAQTSWDPVRDSGNNFTFTTGSSLSGGTQYVECTGCYTLADTYKEPGSDVDFYVVFVDTGSASYSTYSGLTFKSGVQTEGGPFITNGDASGWYNWCNATNTTTGSTNKACLYNSIVGTYASNTHDSFSVYSENTINIWTDTIEIPTNTSGYAVYVCYVDFAGSASSGSQASSGSWTLGVDNIATFISSL